MDWQNTIKQIAKLNDWLNSDIEHLVDEAKDASEITPKSRKHSVPNELVLRVKIAGGHRRDLKVLARKAGGQWYIKLVTDKGDILRDYHYQYREHTNPDESITQRSHKHFPTMKYTLLDSHRGIDTWAYDPEPFPADFGEAVKAFCKENNIDITGIQSRLNLG